MGIKLVFYRKESVIVGDWEGNILAFGVRYSMQPPVLGPQLHPPNDAAATRQLYVRMDPNIQFVVSQMEAMTFLIRASVLPQSNYQYDSRLNTLGRWLCVRRGVALVEPASITELEWLNFLVSWKQQGMGPVNGTAAALIQRQRMFGMSYSFLERPDIKKAMKGAQRCKHVDKGVLNNYMLDQLSELILYMVEMAPLGIPCRCCSGEATGFTKLRQRLELALRVMVEIPLRPDNLKDLQMTNLSFDGVSWILFIKHHKLYPEGGYEVVSPAGVQLLLRAQQLSDNEWLFDKCSMTHLAALLRVAEVFFGWPEGLVYSPHCLRHTGMTKKRQEIYNATVHYVAGISAGTFHGTYTVPSAQRRRL